MFLNIRKYTFMSKKLKFEKVKFKSSRDIKPHKGRIEINILFAYCSFKPLSNIYIYICMFIYIV